MFRSAAYSLPAGNINTGAGRIRSSELLSGIKLLYVCHCDSLLPDRIASQHLIAAAPSCGTACAASFHLQSIASLDAAVNAECAARTCALQERLNNDQSLPPSRNNFDFFPYFWLRIRANFTKGTTWQMRSMHLGRLNA